MCDEWNAVFRLGGSESSLGYARYRDRYSPEESLAAPGPAD